MESFFDFTITPFYYIGMAVWKIMLILIGVTAGETPQAFSEGTWNYITQSLYPLFLAIGSTLLNVFFLIGYLRSVSNLRDGMTLEMFIELCIKVALGNLVIQSIIPIMEQIFDLAGGISKLLIAGTDNPFVQSDMDGGAIFFYAVFGIIYFAVCLVSSVTIFLTVYGRYLQLYLLVLSAPIALENMMDQVDGNDEDGLFLGMLVMVSADSPEMLEQRADTLMQIATSNGFTLDPYYNRQLRAFNTVLPIGGRQVNHMRPLFTSSAVAFQPFYAKDMQSGKFIYGLNTTTKQLLRGDRKALPAPHGIMVGHTGSGKSMLIKITDISQPLLFTDDDVIVIDPNNEQKDYIEELHGQFFDFTPQCQVFLNPFEIPEYVAAGNDVEKNMFIAKKTEFAISFCAAIMTNIVVTQVHMNYISRAVRKMYEDYFKLRTPWSKNKNQPTLCKLRDLLKEEIEKSEYREDRRILLDIVDSMENFTDGPYDMFAHPSNLDIDNRLIGFGLKNLPDSVWEPAMLTIMHFLSMRITYNQQTLVALRLIVDEAQYLCARPSTAEQLLHAVETYRKAGAVVTLAVQNLTRVLEHEDLRDMFSNCPYKCFLDLGGVDAASLAEIMELSSREYRELENPKPGHGVMCWGGQIFLFDTYMNHDNPLYPLLSTNFHEKAAQAAENKQEEMKAYNHE